MGTLISITGLISGLLDHFVIDNTPTALGNLLVGTTADIVNNIVNIAAHLSLLLPVRGA
jgi:hypothetical protein